MMVATRGVKLFALVCISGGDQRGIGTSSQFKPCAGRGFLAQGGFRWVICALLFFATTINYMDRVTMSVLEPVLQKDIAGMPSNGLH